MLTALCKRLFRALRLRGWKFARPRGGDFSRLRPTLIQIETGHMSRGQITEAVHALNGRGYDVYYRGWQGDMLAMRRDWLDEIA